MQKSQQILIILTVTGFLLALQGPLTSFLIALGKMKFVSTSSIVMAVINAVSLLILLPRYGITGAAWAYLISILPIIFVFYYTEKNFLKIDAYRGHLKLLVKIIIVSVPNILISLYVFKPMINNMFTLLISLGLSVLIFFIIYRIFNFFEEEDLDDFKKFMFSFIQKVKCLIK
jgi:O-antigen/teichoic acid export membrane protein